MKSWILRILVAGLLVGISASRPAPATSQEPVEAGPALMCAAGPLESDSFLAEVAQARDLENEDSAKAALAALEPEARRMAAESPDDAAAQYRLAAVLGAQLDHESGRSKMSGASEVREQAQRVLELEPEHPGASYMLGRIHASVLRMSGFKRFLAKQLFGGSALEGASWEQAQALLEVAAREEPCVPEHHFELARVYAHLDDAAGAERELAYVHELTAGRDGRQATRLREKAEEFEREWRDGSAE
jgi:uncharacterized protein (DUF2267 family)